MSKQPHAEAARNRPELAATYVRVSTDRQAERGLSLPAQVDACRAEVARRGWEVFEVYVERGVSGRRESRPELDRMLAAAERRTFHKLVIPKLDRLGRSARDLFNWHNRLMDAGVELVCLSPAIDATTSHGRAQLGMLAVFAEFEREMIAERVADTHARRRAMGLHNGRAPFGYGKDRGRLVPAEPAASTVRRIFAEWVSGTTQYKIAQALRQDEVPAERGEWVQGSVSKLLRNPRYAGLDDDGKPCRCGHAALLDLATWEHAKTRLGGRHRRGGPNRRTAAGHLFLNGFLRCGDCGSALGPRTDKRRGYEVYVCQGPRNNGPGTCSMPPIQRDRLESALIDHFMKTRIDVEAMRAEYERSVELRIADATERRAAAERAAISAADRLARVRRDYQDGRLEAEDWREQRRELLGEEEAARAQVAQLREQEKQLRAAAGPIDAEEEVLRFLAEVRKTMLKPVREAETVDALRAAFLRVYKHFTVHASGSKGAVGLAGESGETNLVLAPIGHDGMFLGPAYADLRVALPIPANSDSVRLQI